MSRAIPTDFEVRELAVPCPHCAASPGSWCRTYHGHFAVYMHSVRFHVMKALEARR